MAFTLRTLTAETFETNCFALFVLTKCSLSLPIYINCYLPCESQAILAYKQRYCNLPVPSKAETAASEWLQCIVVHQGRHSYPPKGDKNIKREGTFVCLHAKRRKPRGHCYKANRHNCASRNATLPMLQLPMLRLQRRQSAAAGRRRSTAHRAPTA